MAEPRTVEDVRREIGREREELARALDVLRVQAEQTRIELARRAKRVATSLLALGGIVAAGVLLVKRVRR